MSAVRVVDLDTTPIVVGPMRPHDCGRLFEAHASLEAYDARKRRARA